MARLKYVFALIFLRLVVYALFHPGHTAQAEPAALAANEAPAKSYAGPWSNDPSPAPLAIATHAANAAPQAVALARDATGHFNIEGQVNGYAANFVVDSGADVVAIPAAQAQQYGIIVNPNDFRPVLRTASGEGMGAFVHLDRLNVAGVELHDVDAVVAEGLRDNLLGQSALKRIGRVAMEGDTMTITPSRY